MKQFYFCYQHISSFASIFSFSFAFLDLPSFRHRATVKLIFKKGNYYNPVNYRPISFTSIVCTIQKRIISNQLTSFFLVNEIIPDAPYGLVPGWSKITIFLNDWTSTPNRRTTIDVVYLNSFKVSISHVLFKLESFGVWWTLLYWIKAFLTIRTFSVKVRQTYSNTRVLSDVPQLSVLESLLFIANVSDFYHCFNKCWQCQVFRRSWYLRGTTPIRPW